MTLLADNIAGITRKEMAAPLCCSERTLKRVLPRLERAGVIVPLVDGAGTRPTIYRTQDLPVIARHLRFPSPLSDVAFWPQKGK